MYSIICNNSNHLVPSLSLSSSARLHVSAVRVAASFISRSSSSLSRVRPSFVSNTQFWNQMTTSTSSSSTFSTSKRCTNRSIAFYKLHGTTTTTTTTTTTRSSHTKNIRTASSTAATVRKSTRFELAAAAISDDSTIQEQQEQPSNSTTTNEQQQQQQQLQQQQQTQPQLVHKVEGLCAVYKPINWTSQDVVSYIRGMLERDARQRGVTLAKRRSRRSKNKIKVGHGGTLDPLAEGVLVLGIGSGTKILKEYLAGDKEYLAKGKFGFETNTLDLEGNVTKQEPYEHITKEDVIQNLDKFMGNTMQIPPMFSAIRQGGKRLYEQARNGVDENDIEIQPREIEITKLDYVHDEEEGLPSFGLSVQCGGGTYIRSLIRDIGYKLDSAATMTGLVRTQQGPFLVKDTLKKDEWSADAIYAAVEKNNLEISYLQQDEFDEDGVETG